MAALVEVTRGNWVESWHEGAIAISDPNGHLLKSIGDVDRPIYPRSAIKALQALPLIESGAADDYNLSSEALSIACASHNGEKIHADTASAMLTACGLGADALECGAQSPNFEKDQALLHKADREPTALHNNCSGKHAGFLCFAQKAGFDHHGYVHVDHPVQREIRAVLADMTEAHFGPDHNIDQCGIDGCSIPTYAIPLRNLAHAFAKFGAGLGMEPLRADAARRLRAAVAEAPYMVAGHDRYCTNVMELLGERAFIKVGAEGVYCASLPELGLGIALKCWDGAFRGAEIMMGAIIDALLPMSEAEHEAFGQFRKFELKNRNGIHVGDVRPAKALIRALKDR